MRTVRHVTGKSGLRWTINAATPERADELEAELTDGPSVPKMASHALQAAVRVVKAAASGQPVVVSWWTYVRRWYRCRRCFFFRPGARWGLAKCAHRKCGCSLRFLKLALATEICPAGNWPA